MTKMDFFRKYINLTLHLSFKGQNVSLFGDFNFQMIMTKHILMYLTSQIFIEPALKSSEIKAQVNKCAIKNTIFGQFLVKSVINASF